MTQVKTHLQRVTSADGTSIAVHASGAGSPLLLVHGALSDHRYWGGLEPFLRDDRSLLALDRRGRGASEDAPEYEYEREVDDLFATVQGFHTDIDVLAHSSGAILALRAAERGLPVRRLVLYEPPLAQFRSESPMTPDFAGKLATLAAHGQLESATAEFLRYGVSMPLGELQQLRASPRWRSLVPFGRSVAYDAAIATEYSLEQRRLAAVRAPTLLLVGATSPDWIKDGTAALAAGLPDARVVKLARQSHNAIVVEPELVAREVLAFLQDGSGPRL